MTKLTEPVPLSQGIWIEEASCGCVLAAAVAIVTGEAGWRIETADEAREHFAPRLHETTYRLVDSTTYRTLNGSGDWNCSAHTIEELIHGRV